MNIENARLLSERTFHGRLGSSLAIEFIPSPKVVVIVSLGHSRSALRC